MSLIIGSFRQKAIEQSRRINTLYEAARMLSSRLTTDELLQELVSHATTLVNARYGAIGIRNEDGMIKSFLTSGLTAKEVSAIEGFPVGKGILGVMLKEKKPLRVENLGEDKRSVGFPPHHPVMKSFLGVPIILGDRVLGSYYFCEKINGEAFTKDDEDILLSLAADASLAIERAELFDRIARHEEELEKIVEERTKELKDAHEELVRKEKLAIMGQMAGSVAHEIKNPLAGIKGAIHYLKSRMKDGDKKNMEYLDMMDHEINVTSKIITDLLDFSRVRPPERQEVDVGDLVSEVLESAKPADNIMVKLDLGTNLPKVFIDRIQIRLVFCNMITNAAHAMTNGGGSLTIRTSIAESGSDGKYIDISFADTGCGIPKEHVDKIFQPLFTTKRSGIGLGLSLSKGFVEANGGRIRLESEVGKGTTFTINLPVA
jgi:signal transduction histidine kinase